MKIFLSIFVALVCVAYNVAAIDYIFCDTTACVYDNVWKLDGERLVTYGYSRCSKAILSRESLTAYIANSKTCKDLRYVFADCIKAAPGACAGFFMNYKDYLGPEYSGLVLKYPRTFYFRKVGELAVVVPISEDGRMHDNWRTQDHFDQWCSEARSQQPGPRNE